MSYIWEFMRYSKVSGLEFVGNIPHAKRLLPTLSDVDDLNSLNSSLCVVKEECNIDIHGKQVELGSKACYAFMSQLIGTLTQNFWDKKKELIRLPFGIHFGMTTKSSME